MFEKHNENNLTDDEIFTSLLLNLPAAACYQKILATLPEVECSKTTSRDFTLFAIFRRARI